MLNTNLVVGKFDPPEESNLDTQVEGTQAEGSQPVVVVD